MKGERDRDGELAGISLIYCVQVSAVSLTANGKRVTIDVLADGKEIGFHLCQFGKCHMRSIRLCFQRIVSSKIVELPNQAWIFLERFRCCEVRRIMFPPEATCTAEGGDTRSSGKASTQ